MAAHGGTVCTGGDGGGAALWELRRLCGAAAQPEPIADLLTVDDRPKVGVASSVQRDDFVMPTVSCSAKHQRVGV